MYVTRGVYSNTEPPISTDQISATHAEHVDVRCGVVVVCVRYHTVPLHHVRSDIVCYSTVVLLCRLLSMLITLRY